MDKREFIEIFGVKDYLAYNAKLAKKKNQLRKALKEKGVLKREGNNAFDRYKYFSEAQYKELFTELFSDAGLELSFTEVAYDTFDGTDKQPNGRMPKLAVYLTDTETGFFEVTYITGEALDKGDKAGYKAYTGAIKYYLATTFLVSTGDDPETESPEGKTGPKNLKKTVTARNTASQDHKITTDAARKLAKLIQIIDEQDKAWWPDTCKLYGISKTTDIDQADYNKICQAAQARIDQLAAEKDGEGAW